MIQFGTPTRVLDVYVMLGIVVRVVLSKNVPLLQILLVDMVMKVDVIVVDAVFATIWMVCVTVLMGFMVTAVKKSPRLVKFR